MTDQYIGEIRNFGFNFAPDGWAPCDGQILPISGHEALYSLLGTAYGGDGRVSFGIPDLRGRVSVNQGQGPSLSHYLIGNTGGTETVKLKEENLPPHTHELMATTGEADTDDPTGGALANTRSSIYYGLSNDSSSSVVKLASGTISAVGENEPMENLQPYQVTYFCISLIGDFPPRK